MNVAVAEWVDFECAAVACKVGLLCFYPCFRLSGARVGDDVVEVEDGVFGWDARGLGTVALAAGG